MKEPWYLGKIGRLDMNMVLNGTSIQIITHTYKDAQEY